MWFEKKSGVDNRGEVRFWIGGGGVVEHFYRSRDEQPPIERSGPVFAKATPRRQGR